MVRDMELHELAPGMVVAVPVSSRDGRVLCAAGASLSPRALQRLRSLGVERVSVFVSDAASSKDAAEQVKHRFRRAVDDPTMEALCELFVSAALGSPEGRTSLGAEVSAAGDEACRSPDPPRVPSRGRLAGVFRWLHHITGGGGERGGGTEGNPGRSGDVASAGPS